MNRRKAIRVALETIYDLSPFNEFLGGTLRLKEIDKEITRLEAYEVPELPASNRAQRLDDQEQRLEIHGKLRDHYIHCLLYTSPSPRD